MFKASTSPPELAQSAQAARIRSVQLCRGLAALLVVLAHLSNLELKYCATSRLAIFGFGNAGVDLFFVISGVVIAATTVGRFGDRGNAGRFLSQRVTRIYPPYWIYSLMVLAVFLWNPLLVNASGGHHVHMLDSFLLIPSELPMLLLQGWTLSYEMYFYVIFAALLLFCPERKLPGVLLFWATLATIGHAMLQANHPIAAVLLSPHVCEFVAGYFLYRAFTRRSTHLAAGAMLVAAGLVWVVALHRWMMVHPAQGAEWIQDSTMLRTWIYGVAATVGLGVCMELERRRVLNFPAAILLLGDWSYSMYLSHTIVLKLVCHSFNRYLPHTSILWITPVALALVVVVSWAGYRWIERPVMRLLRKPVRPEIFSLLRDHWRGEASTRHVPPSAMHVEEETLAA